jgi:hypothetical protein
LSDKGLFKDKEKKMNNVVRNILAVVAGLVCGSIVNMAIVMLGSVVVPPPAGVDPSNMESLAASMHLFQVKHFLFPFLAHAVGALVGALIASIVAASRQMMLALLVGGFFLLGGIAAAAMIPAPVWFEAADILLAYIPMAWIGWRLSGKH